MLDNQSAASARIPGSPVCGQQDLALHSDGVAGKRAETPRPIRVSRFGAGVRDLLAMTMSRFSTIALAVATQSVLAWMLGPAGRGEYATCMVFALLMGVILAFGQPLAISYFVSAKTITANQAISFLFLSATVSTLLVTIVGVVCIQLPLPFFEKAPYSAFVVSIGWAMCLLWSDYVQFLMQGMRRFGLLARLSVMRSVIALAGTALLTSCTTLGILGPIAADAFASICLVTVGLLSLLRSIRYRWCLPLLHRARALLHYGARAYASSIGMPINTTIGTVLVAFLATKSEIGVFSLSMGVLLQFVSFSIVLSNVLQPRVAANSDGRADLVAFCCRAVLLLIGVSLGAVLLLSRPLVTALFSDQFLPAVPLFWILAPGVLVRCVAKCTESYFNGTNRPGVISTATVVNLVVNIVAVIVLLPALGACGAACAATLGYFCNAAVLIWSFCRHSKMSLASVLPRPADLSRLRSLLLQRGIPK